MAGKFRIALFLLVIGFAFTVEAVKNESKEAQDTCFEDRKGIFPCSSSITGNLLLMLFYGGILGCAAKLISDGAEMLLELGVSASVVGGLILPLLGAVPDSAIIVVSGLGPKEDAQRKLSVGMGTLAGSTVMLLTVAWAGSLAIGKCDLNSKGESIDGTGSGKIRCRKQGITLLPEVKTGILLMLMTSLFYLVVQSADWHFGPTNTKSPQPAYVRNAALVTMVLCFLGLFGNIAFLMYDSKAAERRARQYREEMIQRRVLHTFLRSANTNIFKPKSEEGKETQKEGKDDSDVTSKAVGKKYFKAWHARKGMRDEDAEDSAPATEESQLLAESEPKGEFKAVEQPVEEESKGKLAFKSLSMLLGGVALVTIFADPMCGVLDALTSKRNSPHRIPISSFYVSFVVTPLCSNASELLSSLIFASKKKTENATITYSQLFGASTMNNTMCLGIFMALVYFRELDWYYSAEVLSILACQWAVGIISYRKTFVLWMALPVSLIYVMSLLLVFVLEKLAHWR